MEPAETQILHSPSSAISLHSVVRTPAKAQTTRVSAPRPMDCGQTVGFGELPWLSLPITQSAD